METRVVLQGACPAAYDREGAGAPPAVFRRFARAQYINIYVNICAALQRHLGRVTRVWGEHRMQPVDSNLSFLNDMLHHPLVFRLDAGTQKYVSKSTLNSGASIDSRALIFSQGRCAHLRLLATMQSNRDFLVLLVFKLLGRGIYISSRNVAIVQGDGDGGEDGSISGPATPPRAAIVLHCDVIAFHAKKRHVYPIVVCDDSTHLQQCRAHALRVAHSMRCATPRHSTVFPFVLTVYDFDRTGSMRLCTVPPPHSGTGTQ